MVQQQQNVSSSTYSIHTLYVCIPNMGTETWTMSVVSVSILLSKDRYS